MNQASETNSNRNSNNKTKIIIAVSAAVVVVVIAVCITVVALSRDKEDSSGPTIGYASNAVVVMDQDALQAAADAARENAKNNMVALSYKNNAYSTDGKTFSCYLGNGASNLYDMFLTIFTDAEMTDQVYMSGLVRPGNGFKEITLDRALDPGDHTMYVALTQVATEEDGTQVIKNQIAHTVEFHVTPQ